MHRAVHADADQTVGDDERSRTSSGEHLTGTDEQSRTWVAVRKKVPKANPKCQVRGRLGLATTRRTYAAANGNHLQMPALETARQRGVGRVGGGALDIEDLAVGGDGGLWGHGHVGVALEAIKDAPADAIPVHRGLAIVGCRLRLPSEALLGAVVVVVVEGHGCVEGLAGRCGVGPRAGRRRWKAQRPG